MRGRENLRDVQRSRRRPIESLTAETRVLLDENCFVSAQSIAKTLQVSHSTVLKYLHEDLGFKSLHLRWVQHLLTAELKEQRRTDATKMIAVLLSAEKDGWHLLVTRNESWFFLSYSPRRMWTLKRDDIASKL
jgi:predicted transcriptional regulator